MSSVIARTSVSSGAAFVEVWKDAMELSVRVTGMGTNWSGTIYLGSSPSIDPGPEHPWIRNRVCEALYSAMGRYGFDKHTKTLLSTTPGWYEVRQLANTELAGGRELPE